MNDFYRLHTKQQPGANHRETQAYLEKLATKFTLAGWHQHKQELAEDVAADVGITAKQFNAMRRRYRRELARGVK